MLSRASSLFKRGKNKNIEITVVKDGSNTTDNEEITIPDIFDEDDSDMTQVTLLVIGGGNRGNVYGQYAKDFPKRLKIVGVAEPREKRREMYQKTFHVEPDLAFAHWEDAANREKFADAVCIATLDDMHHAPCIAFADLGYHILCEKPMAPTEKECEEMAEACKRNGVMLAVGHVLRYNNTNRGIKKMLDDGAIGDIVGIQHLEPVGWWHFAHSFVRGNWNKEVKDIGSLMAKSCHDIDLIKYFLGNNTCKKVQSFGKLVHFNEQNKPNEAGDRCLDCKIEQTCPYSAVRQYLEPAKLGCPHWSAYVITDIPDIENITEALRTGPYGKCVYSSDNDVCDYQTVNMEFEGGKYATFIMSAFTKDVCQRKIKIFGTKGELDVDGTKIKLFDFLSRKETVIRCERPSELTTMYGHGYADYYLMRAFVRAVATNDESLIQSGAEDSLRGHRLVFAADKSRKLGGVMLEIDI